jgi:hypothetical protein
MKVLCLKNDEKKKLGKTLLGKFLLSSCRVCFGLYAFYLTTNPWERSRCMMSTCEEVFPK